MQLGGYQEQSINHPSSQKFRWNNLTHVSSVHIETLD